MATTPIVNVAGATPVKTDTDTANALEIIGYTRDGCSVTFEAYTLDVHSDDYGGDAGPPIDVQYLGETARIRLELTKYDAAASNKLRARLYTNTTETAHIPGTPGTLFIAGSKTYRLVLASTTLPLNFPTVMFKDPHEVNKGSKFSTLILEATAFKNPTTGVLYNEVVS